MPARRYGHTGLRKDRGRFARSAAKRHTATTSESERGQEYDMEDNLCKICREAETIAVPTVATQHSLFRKQGAPLFLCPICDGEALARVLGEHDLDVDVTKP